MTPVFSKLSKELLFATLMSIVYGAAIFWYFQFQGTSKFDRLNFPLLSYFILCSHIFSSFSLQVAQFIPEIWLDRTDKHRLAFIVLFSSAIVYLISGAIIIIAFVEPSKIDLFALSLCFVWTVDSVCASIARIAKGDYPRVNLIFAKISSFLTIFASLYYLFWLISISTRENY